MTGLPPAFSPVPRSVIDRRVDVSNPRRHGERRRSKHRTDVQVLGTVLNEQHAARQRFCHGRIDDGLRRWFVWESPGSRGRTSLPGRWRRG